MRKETIVGYLGGAFDMFRVDHLDQLIGAHERCDVLIVGVFTDELIAELTGKEPVIPFAERLEIVRSMRGADVTFCQNSELLSDVWVQVRFDVAFVPHAIDAAHTDYNELASVGVEVIPLPPGRVTTSALKQYVSI